jgi:hypothetical protein
MDFLHGAEHFGEGVVQNMVNPIARVGNEVGAFGLDVSALGQGLTGNQQGMQQTSQSAQNLLNPGGGLLHQGGVLQGQESNGQALNLSDYGKIAGTGAEIASNVVGGGAYKGAEKVGSLVMDFIQGAKAGALAGALGTAGGELASGQSLNPVQIAEGAVGTGLFGGVLHAAPRTIGAAKDLNKSLAQTGGGKPFPLSDETAQKLADTSSEKSIHKQLDAAVGPIVAKDVAPAVAGQKDPEIIKNIINNDVNKKIAPATPTQPTEPLPPQTSTTDVNSSQQVAGQASEAVANYTPDQQSLDETAPFMNAPGETNPQPTTTGKLGAISGMDSIVKNGGTVDQALNHYMETTGKGYGEAQSEFNKLYQQQGSHGNINASLNPEFENAQKLIPKATNDDQVINNARMVRNEVVRRGNAAMAEVDKLSKNDLALMDSTRNTDPTTLVQQAEDHDQFLKAAQTVKSYNDFTQAVGSGALGQDVAYRQNYGAPLKFDTSPESQATLKATNVNLPSQPGYGKGRYVQSYEDAPNVPRKNENFLGDLHDDITKRSNDLSQLTLSKGFEESHPGQMKVGTIGSTPEGTYRQLIIPGGSKISLPADIANKINERAPVPGANGLLGKYDTLNSNFKNLKLAGGGFHSVNVMGSYVGQQIASGNFVKDPGAISGMIKATLSDSSFKSEVDNWAQSGRLLDMDAAGLEHNAGSIQADIAPTGKILANIPGLKQIHSAIFDRQIPYMKMKIFDQETQGLDRNNPEDLTKMTQIAKELNQNFGGMNRSIQGLTPKQFKVMSRVFLATDYNEGQLRSLADAFTKGGADGKLARQVVFGKALLWGGLATAGGAVGGEFQGQTPKQIALNVLQKTIDPSFKFGQYTVGLPTSQVSEVGKPLLQTGRDIANGTNAFNPTKDFASARLAAIPSAAEQFVTNRNFSGQAIRGTDYYGRPISPLQTGENVAGMISPIPLAQGLQTVSGAQSAGAAIANIAGLRATPTNSMEYAPVYGQTYLAQLKATPGTSQAKIDSTTQFMSALGAGDSGKSKVLHKAITDLKGNNDPTKAQADIDAYNQKLVAALQPWVKSGGQQYLDSTMLAILRQEMITFKSVNSNAKYDVKTNPTAYGVPIQALAQQRTPVK